MSKSLKPTEVAEHKKPDSLWIIIDGDVYDVTKVAAQNPRSREKTVVDNVCDMTVPGGAPRREKEYVCCAAHRRWQHNETEN
jgi:hypothetical protein